MLDAEQAGQWFLSQFRFVAKGAYVMCACAKDVCVAGAISCAHGRYDTRKSENVVEK